jgi:tRNA nucleotidyltransferase (CCA-adding enzyme)
MSFPPTLEIPRQVLEIARRLEQAGYQAWCVGGAVRDAILGHPHTDYDLATSATPEQVRAIFRRTVPVGEKYGTIGVLDAQRVLHEVTTFRRDVATDGRHAEVTYGVSLEDDLARRDFTINAIAYHPLTHQWSDPFGGDTDLRHGVVRAVGNPARRFREDYLRVLRMIRFAARFGFTIDPATWTAARTAAASLDRLSPERVREEWCKGLRTARSVSNLVTLWRESGAAGVWLPELRLPLRQETDQVEGAERDPVLLSVLLCRDAAAVLRRLRAPNVDIDRAAALSAAPDQPSGVDEPSVRRWLSAAGSAADDLITLWRLRHGGEPGWAATVRVIRRRGDPVTRGDLAVTGHDLTALGVTGRRVGEVLAMLLDRVLEQPALNTREALIALVKEWS